MRPDNDLGLDLRSLAVLRIALGAVIFWDLVLRSFDLVAHYTDQGILPRQMLLELSWQPSFLCLHLLNGSWQVQAVLFALAGVLALAMMVGYRTRLATVLTWFFLISLHSRNILILNGGDVVLRTVLFWCMFLPWGARWSVDAARQPAWKELPDRFLSMASLGYLVQLSSIYVFAVLLKAGAEWRVEGTALYYALSLDQFTSVFGHYLLDFPDLLRFLTRLTFWIEVLAPVLLLSPVFSHITRTVAVVALAAMHLAISLVLHIGMFSPIILSVLLGALPGNLWPALNLEGLSKRLPATTPGPFPPGYRLGRLPSALLALLLVYVTVWNFDMLPGSTVHVPPSLKWLGLGLRLDQRWNMFAPTVLRDDGWYVIEGTLQDGTTVDLFRGGAPVSWEKPELVSATYPNERWRKYLMSLYQSNYSLLRDRYCTWLARSYRGPGEVVQVRMYFMLERTLPDYRPPEVLKSLLWTHQVLRPPSQVPLDGEIRGGL